MSRLGAIVQILPTHLFCLNTSARFSRLPPVAFPRKATLFLEASSYNLGIVKQVMDLNYILEPLPSDQPEKKWEGKN